MTPATALVDRARKRIDAFDATVDEFVADHTGTTTDTVDTELVVRATVSADVPVEWSARVYDIATDLRDALATSVSDADRRDESGMLVIVSRVANAPDPTAVAVRLAGVAPSRFQFSKAGGTVEELSAPAVDVWADGIEVARFKLIGFENQPVVKLGIGTSVGAAFGIDGDWWWPATDVLRAMAAAVELCVQRA